MIGTRRRNGKGKGEWFMKRGVIDYDAMQGESRSDITISLSEDMNCREAIENHSLF